MDVTSFYGSFPANVGSLLGGRKTGIFLLSKMTAGMKYKAYKQSLTFFIFFYFELLIKTRSCFLFSFIASSCFDRNVCAWKWSSKQYFCYHLSGMQTQEICLSVQ